MPKMSEIPGNWSRSHVLENSSSRDSGGWEKRFQEESGGLDLWGILIERKSLIKFGGLI